jgi:diguanylate cyclase (GGDEF)-like protein/PAS domain S-box-containing protein
VVIKKIQKREIPAMESNETGENQSGRIWFILSLILLFFVIVAGYFLTGYLGDKARQEIIEHNDNVTSLHASHFSGEFNKIERAVKTMSGSPWIVPALISRKVEDIAKADSVLDRYNSIFESSVCYLMDSKGITIASSNRNSSDSFVGKSYQFRPYFTQAVKGSLGRYFALGITSLKRGFYASYPVMDGKGAIIGVVVIKHDIDAEESHLAKYPNCYVIDPNGVVFLSSRKEMNFKSLWPLGNETRLALLESKQFGKSEFEPILPNEIIDRMEISFEGKKNIVSSRAINLEGWSIVLMTTTERIYIYKSAGVIITILLCIFIIVPLTIHYKTSSLSEKMRESEIRFRMLFKNITSGFALHEIILNDEGQPCDYRFLEINPAFEQLTGLQAKDLIGRTVLDVLPDTEPQWIENYGRVAMTGKPTHFDDYSAEMGRYYECLAYSPRQGQFAVIFTDITDRKRMQDEIVAFSITDQLTGLYNRRGFLSLAEQQLKLSDRTKSGMLLFFADLDLLKQINDTLGHEEGDKALIEAANVLRETFRTSDIIARLGGDEFAVLAIDSDESSSVIFGDRLQQRVDIWNSQENRHFRLSISIGCAYYDPINPCSIDDLIGRADKQMYEQKQKRRKA